MDESAYSSIVVPTRLEKLPEEVQLTWTRGEAFRQWTVKNLVDRLRQEVDLRERSTRSKEQDDQGQEQN